MPQETRAEAIKRFDELKSRANEFGVLGTDDLLESRRLYRQHNLSDHVRKTDTRDAPVPETRNDNSTAEPVMTRAEWAALQVNEPAPEHREDSGQRGARSLAEADAIRARYAGSTRGREIQGTPEETLHRGQSMKEWVHRAAQNGVTSEVGGRGRLMPVRAQSDEYLNEYWGQRMGLSHGNAETRAIQEDTSGSGLAITPQSWSAAFIDYLYAATVLGRAGISTFPMATEIVNKPQLTEPAQAAWLAEASTIGIDANPAFAPLVFNANGGYKDITLVSIEQMQDAYLSGGLSAVLAESVSRSVALAFDVAGIQGIAGNPLGAPGLINEAGFVSRGCTGDSGSGYTATDTTELSKIAEISNKANVPTEMLGVITNPQVKATWSRLNASTYAKYWDFPQDVADLAANRWYTTTNPNVVPATETDGTDGAGGALTGGALSSLYCGPWGFMLAGLHLDLRTQVLRERYVDTGMVGLFTFARFSIRTSHPQTFSRSGGIVTS